MKLSTRVWLTLVGAVPAAPVAVKQFKNIRKRSAEQLPDADKGAVILLPFRINPNAQWFEYLIAYALRQRGYRSVMGIGESAVSYTDGYFVSRNRWLSRLPSLWRSQQFAEGFDIEQCSFRTLLGRRVLSRLRKEAYSASLDEIPAYRKHGVLVGQQVLGSLSRYFLRCEVDLQKNERVSREFLYTALVSVEAARQMVARYQPRLLISSHGIYASWGAFCEYFRQRSIPYVTWGFQYRKHAFIFSHNNSYHRDIIEEKADQWMAYQFGKVQREAITAYVRDKGSTGSHSDNISYYAPNGNREVDIRAQLGIREGKRIYGMFPNLGWDAQVSFRPLFFRNMNEWIVETVAWFIEHPDAVLIIRSHPAEIRGTAETVEKTVDIVRSEFPVLPDNIRVLPADSAITSYQVLQAAAVCLVYGSKFGLEAAVARKPLVICGEAYFRDKGMSYDPKSKEEYFALLGARPDQTPVTAEMHEMALRYGYHYNFRRQYYLPLAELQGVEFKQYLFDDTSALLPGKLPELDDFVSRCFSGEPFVSEAPQS